MLRLCLMLGGVLLLVACQPPAKEPVLFTVVHEQKRYPVYGTTIAEVAVSIDRQTAQARHPHQGRWAGYTDMTYDYDYRLSVREGKCRLLSPHITLTTTVTLPEWQDANKAKADARAWWSRMIAALSAHEAGHVQIAEAALPEMIGSLQAIAPAATCDTVARAVIEVIRTHETELAAAHQAYEIKTDHGRRQEAHLLEQ